MNYTPNVDHDIVAMGHSVNLINKMFKVTLPSSGKHKYSTYDNINRNINHIKIMLDKDHIKNSGKDLSLFEKVIKDTNKFLSENSFEEKNNDIELL
jgi:hypothetical protein